MGWNGGLIAATLSGVIGKRTEALLVYLIPKRFAGSLTAS
jgi:hypothetical protein